MSHLKEHIVYILKQVNQKQQMSVSQPCSREECNEAMLGSTHLKGQNQTTDFPSDFELIAEALSSIYKQ